MCQEQWEEGEKEKDDDLNQARLHFRPSDLDSWWRGWDPFEKWVTDFTSTRPRPRPSGVGEGLEPQRVLRGGDGGAL